MAWEDGMLTFERNDEGKLKEMLSTPAIPASWDNGIVMDVVFVVMKSTNFLSCCDDKIYIFDNGIDASALSY